jgi:hypothetical protein
MGGPSPVIIYSASEKFSPKPAAGNRETSNYPKPATTMSPYAAASASEPPAKAIVQTFGLAAAPPLQPRYNIVPTQQVAAMRLDPQTGTRHVRRHAVADRKPSHEYGVINLPTSCCRGVDFRPRFFRRLRIEPGRTRNRFAIWFSFGSRKPRLRSRSCRSSSVT